MAINSEHIQVLVNFYPCKCTFTGLSLLNFDIITSIYQRKDKKNLEKKKCPFRDMSCLYLY